MLRTLPGYALLPNAGGGDCGAHSIGAFVGADHAAVRAAVVSYIAHDATALQPVYDGDAAGGDLDAFVIASLAHWIDTAHAREHRYSQPTRAIYCDLMGRPGTFFDDAALLAAALAFQRPVVAHCARSDGSTVAPVIFQPPAATGDPIVLACELDVHFVAVGATQPLLELPRSTSHSADAHLITVEPTGLTPSERAAIAAAIAASLADRGPPPPDDLALALAESRAYAADTLTEQADHARRMEAAVCETQLVDMASRISTTPPHGLPAATGSDHDDVQRALNSAAADAFFAANAPIAAGVCGDLDLSDDPGAAAARLDGDLDLSHEVAIADVADGDLDLTGENAVAGRALSGGPSVMDDLRSDEPCYSCCGTGEVGDAYEECTSCGGSGFDRGGPGSDDMQVDEPGHACHADAPPPRRVSFSDVPTVHTYSADQPVVSPSPAWTLQVIAATSEPYPTSDPRWCEVTGSRVASRGSPGFWLRKGLAAEATPPARDGILVGGGGTAGAADRDQERPPDEGPSREPGDQPRSASSQPPAATERVRFASDEAPQEITLKEAVTLYERMIEATAGPDAVLMQSHGPGLLRLIDRLRKLEMKQFSWPLRGMPEVRRLLRSPLAPTDLVGFEFSASMRSALERRGRLAVSVDERDCDKGGMHICLDVRLVLALQHWHRAYLFPPCFQQLRADEDCLPLKIADGRAFWGCLLVILCLCADADMVLVEQPDTIVCDYLPYDHVDLRSSAFGDATSKFIRLGVRGASLELPTHSLARDPSTAPMPAAHYANPEERDRAKSSWQPFPRLCDHLAALRPSASVPPRPSFSEWAEWFAVEWFTAGHPVPHGYLDAAARPPSAEERSYQLQRGPGDGRSVHAVVPASLLNPSWPEAGDDDAPGSSSAPPSPQPHRPPRPSLLAGADETRVDSSGPALDLRVATSAAVVLVLVSVLSAPLVYAHVNGFTVLGAEMPERLSRPDCQRHAQGWTDLASDAVHHSFMVGEYVGGCRLFTSPLDLLPPPSAVCRSARQRRRLLSSGASFVWCTLAALGDTASGDVAARSLLAVESFVKPMSQMVDFASAGSAPAVTFRFGAAPATSLLRRPIASLASPPAWRALADSIHSGQLLESALRAERLDHLLDGWLERITPLDSTAIPPEMLDQLWNFADERLSQAALSPVKPPLRTPWLPRPPLQPAPSPDAPACVRSPLEMLPPAARARLDAWLDATLADLTQVRDALASGADPGDIERHRPPPIAIGQGELYVWARGLVWDCRGACCKPLDFHAPTDTHLDLDYLRRRLEGYPDQHLVANLLEGVRLDADLELHTVLVPHLTSLSKGFASVEKELHRLRDLGWYGLFATFPFWPMYLNGQGATARKLEPDRFRRTTEGGGPRRDVFDGDGLRALSINEASHLPHFPRYFQLDERPEFRAWLEARGLPRDMGEEPLGSRPNEQPTSKYPKETKPTLAEFMRDLAVLRHAAHVLREPIYVFGDDAKDYFNQLAMSSSELWKLGIVFLASDGDLDAAAAAADSPTSERDRLVFVSELRLGFGTHGASNIAQRFSDALLHMFRADMDRADEPTIPPEWRRRRARVSARVGDCFLDGTMNICPQERLYAAYMYTDDAVFAVVGVQRAIRALRAWRQLTSNVNLLMAVPEKRSLGVWCVWLGVIIVASLGLVVVPKDKLLRAAAAITATLEGRAEFHVYRSLCGLLEHFRAINLAGRNVMHGLYRPHGSSEAGRLGPNELVSCDVLMTKQLWRWRRLLTQTSGTCVVAAVERFELDRPIALTVIICGDACFGDDDPSGLGGFCHGFHWHFLVPTEDYAILTTPLLEFLAAAFNILVFSSLVGGLASSDTFSVLLRTDALTTALTLPRESQRSYGLVETFQWLRSRPEFTALLPRLRVAHLYGDANPFSDRISRSRWSEFGRLCVQAHITPTRVDLPPAAHQLYQHVVSALRARPHIHAGAGELPTAPTLGSTLALERSGVRLLHTNRTWLTLLAPLAEIAVASACARRTDIVWLHMERGIVEATIVPDVNYWPAFRGDAGAMVSSQPPRSSSSHYWAVADYVFQGRFYRRLVQRIEEHAGRNALDGLVLAGVQLARAPAGSGRGLHHDQESIARLLVTFSLEGEGWIRICGEDPDGDDIDTWFRQTDGDGYVLFGHGTTGVKHDAAAGAAGRWAATFRFAREIQPRPPTRPHIRAGADSDSSAVPGWTPGSAGGEAMMHWCRCRAAARARFDVGPASQPPHPLCWHRSSGGLCTDCSPPPALAAVVIPPRADLAQFHMLSARRVAEQTCRCLCPACALGRKAAPSWRWRWQPEKGGSTEIAASDAEDDFSRAPDAIQDDSTCPACAEEEAAAPPSLTQPCTRPHLHAGGTFLERMGEVTPPRASSAAAAAASPSPPSAGASHTTASPASPVEHGAPGSSSFLARISSAGSAAASAGASAAPAIAPRAAPALALSMPARPRTSALAAASVHYAQMRAASLASGGEPDMQLAVSLEDISNSLLTIEDISDFGVNANTAKMDERAWTMFELICERFGTSPLRTRADVREYPQRTLHLLACLLLHAFVVGVPRDPARKYIKPRSALAYPLAIIRIFARWGVELPGYKMLVAEVNGLMRLYVRYHGPHSLAPRRAEPMRFATVIRINQIPVDGRLVGNLTWSDSTHLVFTFRRLNRFLIRTAFRLGEIVSHTSGEIMYLTRASVVWRINGVLIANPTAAQLSGMLPGRDGCLVSPPRSKPDQWAEMHCPFTIFLLLSTSPECACGALRDIELARPCSGVAREATALFADERGQPYTHAKLDPILRIVLTYLFGAAVASIFSWHSYRVGLATMLHAANVPDAVIMLMCRWMCEKSLHVYRRLGASEHERNFQRGTRAAVDSIQTANVVSVVGDQGYAHLLNHLNGNRDRAAAIQDFATALSGQQAAPAAPAPAATGRAAARPAAAPPARAAAHAPPQPPQAPPPPPDLRPLAPDNAVGRRVLVSRARWPQYACREHGGTGWEATVSSATRTTAVVRFSFATTADGRLYQNERVPYGDLSPL